MSSVLLPLLLLSMSGAAAGRVFNLRHYGAVGDNATYDTVAVRKAAAALAQAGGGTLLFPAGGNFLIGPLNISSHNTVVIEAYQSTL